MLTVFGKSIIFQAWPILCQHLEGFPADPVVLVTDVYRERLIGMAVDEVTACKVCQLFIVGILSTTAALYRMYFILITLYYYIKWQWFCNYFKSSVCVRCRGERHGSDAPFRKWCGLVGELRSLLPVSLPVLSLTATASLTTCKKIMKHLGLQKCLEVVRSPDRSNIRLAVKKVSSDATNTLS